MKIKVCGLREISNIRSVSELDVDYLGFIFYASSPRCVPNADEYLSECIHGMTKPTIGVFVNASLEDILATASRYNLKIIQLHGNESPVLCQSLHSRGYKIIKAFSISDVDDLQQTATYESSVDYFLFDTKTAGYGGSGVSFDWSILSSYNGEIPFFLSGGLGMESLPALSKFSHDRLAGIDLNSRFEHTPGRKDIQKLRDFIEAFHRGTNQN
jgi:phosphoribosylanthranilate isomerase